MRKIRKGDEVIVIAGKDKGRRGVVLLRKDDERLLVEGINMVKKHVRPNPATNTRGGVETKPMPIHQSNVAIFNPATGKADRVGIKLGEGGTRSRVFKSNGAPVPVPARPTSAAA